MMKQTTNLKRIIFTPSYVVLCVMLFPVVAFAGAPLPPFNFLDQFFSDGVITLEIFSPPLSTTTIATIPFSGDTIVIRGQPDVGGVIQTEIVSMSLTGFDPALGPIVVRESTTQPSNGQVVNATFDGSGNFLSGDSFFDVFVEIDLPAIGQTAFNQNPVPLEALSIAQLPPLCFTFHPPVSYVPVEIFTLSSSVLSNTCLRRRRVLSGNPTMLTPVRNASCSSDFLVQTTRPFTLRG